MLMFVLFILVMNFEITGIFWHEILGIFILGLFLLHQILNFKWIKTITKNIANKKLPIKTKIMYILNVIILISIIITVISGILISQYLFIELRSYNTIFWTTIHNVFAYLSLGLITIHILLHIPFIKTAIIKLKTQKLSILTVILSLLGLVAMAYNNFIKPIEIAKTIENTDDTSSKTTTITDDTTTNTTIKDTTSSDPTLDEYLGSLTCGGCSNRCALNNIRCDRGDAYVETATTAYNDIYS